MIDPRPYVRNPSDEQAIADGCYVDIDAAERVRTFCRRFLRHSKGQWAGRPFDPLPWQWDDVILPLYGWRRPDGTRRFRRCGIWIAKKNGKSTLMSALSLYHLCGDGEQGAEVYNAANDRDQASIVFNEAANMVRASPTLTRFLTVIDSRKRIDFDKSNSFYRALSADVPTKEGINWSFLCYDEIHAAKKADLYETLRYGGIARRQPLEVTISTAGFDRLSIGYELYDYARRVQSGDVIDTSFLPAVYEVPADADWQNPELWHLANPSLGSTLDIEEMKVAVAEAASTPSRENAFRRYRLNQWTEQETRWLSLRHWDDCRVDDWPDLTGRRCFGGLDLASTTDLTALVLVFPVDGSYYVVPYYWLPRDTQMLRDKGANTRTFLQWSTQGHIKRTSGNVADYDVIRDDIVALSKRYKIVDLALDRWNSTHLATQLQKSRVNVVMFGQGYASMTAPTKRLETSVLGRKIRHDGHPVLRWNVGNVVVEMDAAGNLKPSKAKSTEKIDGVVALIMALGRVMVDEGESVYKRRGIATL